MITYAFKSNNNNNKKKKRKKKVLLCYDQGDILLQMYLYRNVTFYFFWQVKVYSFVVVLEATLKGYTIVFIFFLSVYTLCTQGAFLNGV